MSDEAAGRPNSRRLLDLIGSDDAEGVRRLLDGDPGLKARINEPIGPFDSPPLNSASSGAMIDVLLAAGADINAKSRWWAGGFGFLHMGELRLAAHAIERGAIVDIHAAARLGALDRLRWWIEQDPLSVHARGGDGQTPLHFARTVEVAGILLDHGAEIDALDVDHESTPAQYMVGDQMEVARHLVRRGCRTDILLAAAAGNADRVREHLDADPGSLQVRVTDEFFPMRDPRAGGTIYQWTLGSGASVYQAASKGGDPEVLRLLLDRSPLGAKLIAACWLHDEATVARLKAEHPDILANLSEVDASAIAQAARNNDTRAVLLMLDAGLSVRARGQHGGTPLHWAAWHGNLELVRALLPSNPAIEDAENEFDATPLRWATHGSENGWHRESGDYPAVVRALLESGAIRPPTISGTDAVRVVLLEG